MRRFIEKTVLQQLCDKAHLTRYRDERIKDENERSGLKWLAYVTFITHRQITAANLQLHVALRPTAQQLKLVMSPLNLLRSLDTIVPPRRRRDRRYIMLPAV